MLLLRAGVKHCEQLSEYLAEAEAADKTPRMRATLSALRLSTVEQKKVKACTARPVMEEASTPR
jgi:hypothetical protein